MEHLKHIRYLLLILLALNWFCQCLHFRGCWWDICGGIQDHPVPPLPSYTCTSLWHLCPFGSALLWHCVPSPMALGSSIFHSPRNTCLLLLSVQALHLRTRISHLVNRKIAATAEQAAAKPQGGAAGAWPSAESVFQCVWIIQLFAGFVPPFHLTAFLNFVFSASLLQNIRLMFVGNCSWGLSRLLSWSPSYLKDCYVCKASIAVPALGVALCFPALNLNWHFKSNFVWAEVTFNVRKFRHCSHRPSRWSLGVTGVLCPCCLWRKSRGSDRSCCSAGWADTSLPCCLQLGMTLELTGVLLVPLAHLPL